MNQVEKKILRQLLWNYTISFEDTEPVLSQAGRLNREMPCLK